MYGKLTISTTAVVAVVAVLIRRTVRFQQDALCDRRFHRGQLTHSASPGATVPIAKRSCYGRTVKFKIQKKKQKTESFAFAPKTKFKNHHYFTWDMVSYLVQDNLVSRSTHRPINISGPIRCCHYIWCSHSRATMAAHRMRRICVMP